MTDHSDPNTSTFEVITDQMMDEYREHDEQERAKREAEREALKPRVETLKEQVAELEDEDPAVKRAAAISLTVEAVSAPPLGGLPLGSVIALLADFTNWMTAKGVVLAERGSAPLEGELTTHPFQSDLADMMTLFITEVGQ